MKQYIYYASEHDAYQEVFKHQTINVIEDILYYLSSNGMGKVESYNLIEALMETFNKNGYVTYMGYANDNYQYIIGIANYGCCNEVRKYIEGIQKELTYW